MYRIHLIRKIGKTRTAIVLFGQVYYWLLVFIIACLISDPVLALTHLIADQYDWQSNRGFYLAIESQRAAHGKCVLEGAKLVLGVGSGSGWHFLVATIRWQFDRSYLVKTVLTRNDAKLWINGKLTARSAAILKPFPGWLFLNRVQTWTLEPTDYILIVESVDIQGGRPRVCAKFKVTPQTSILLAIEPQNPRRIKWTPDLSKPIEIRAVIKFVSYPDIRSVAPIIDRYGQLRCTNWPGKVRKDRDITQDMLREQRQLRGWGNAPGLDRFGGWKLAGWSEKPTGFYRVTRRSGFWWLVTPEGNPCFYLGVCTAPGLNWPATPVTGREYLFEWLPPRQGEYASAWRRGAWGGDADIEYVSFHTANLIRKYGPNWRAKAQECAKNRLRSWGFSGVGKWGELEGLPVVPVLNRAGVPNLVRHPDVFDPSVRAKFAEVLRKQVEPRRNDPMVVGWSLGNEFEEIITAEEIREILKKPKSTPARKELTRLAPPGDIEAMRRCYAKAYYEFIYNTIKSIDPNHLYFGFWIVPGWWENEEDWHLIARYCDVIGYDLYSFEFADERLVRLVERWRKPILCGEFSFPPFYHGNRGFGCYSVWSQNDADAGKMYGEYVRAAASNPYCVGIIWFEYRDQPLTGRGAGRQIGPVIGEHYAFGLVDVTDRPKWDLVRRVREANLNAPKWRAQAAKKGTRL